MCESWFLNWAPCPPFFIDDVYVVFITHANRQNLTECEIETIREKCDIEIPTTTTTTTTTTSTTTPTTTSTSTIPSTTEIANFTVTQNATESSSVSVTFTPTDGTPFTNASVTSSTSTSASQTNGSTISGIFNASVTTDSGTFLSTNESSTVNLKTFQSSSTPSDDLNVTINNSTEVPLLTASGGEALCPGVCLIVVTTAVMCVAIILFAVVAVLLRKLRDDGKRERGRSRTRARNRYAEVPNTDLYDSVDLPSYSNRSSGSEIWHDSSDYSLRSVLRNDPSDFSIKEHTFVNPAFRRSFEPPSRNSVFWYDPDAADPEYLQRNANLTRHSRSPDRKSPPKTLLNNQKEVDKYRARSRSANHVSIRDYVPKAVQYVDNLEQLPYQKSNGDVRDIRGKSPSKRSLPRTPIEVRQNTSQESMSPPQRPSYRRSRSYDLDAPRPPRSRDEDGFYTVDTRHSRKHYIKNSQRNKQNGQNSRDRSVKGKLHRYSESEADEVVVMSPNLGQGQIQRLSNQSLDLSDNRVLSSNLRPGSYKYRSHQTFLVDDDTSNHYNKRSRSRSHKELRERSPSIQVRRDGRMSNYRSLKPDQIYVFQTKL